MWLCGALRGNDDEVLHKLSLRFKASDLEHKYMEVHWMSQKYWLRGTIFCVFAYSLFWVTLYAVGDESVVTFLDFRMDHYRKSVANFGNADESWGSMLISVESGGRFYVHPYVFIGWHIIWCIFFMFIVFCDLRCCTAGRTWGLRAWITCGLMTLDLVITAFVNPTVTRFLLFVYALLIRVTWIQALWLVCVCSGAIVVSGRVATHAFLTSVSVGEFAVTNIVILAASRQLETNQRLSMYRLWLLKFHNKSPGWEASETLSLKAFDIFPIQEENNGDWTPRAASEREGSLASSRLRRNPYSPSKASSLGHPVLDDAASESSFLTARSMLAMSSQDSVFRGEVGVWEHAGSCSIKKDGNVTNSYGEGTNADWAFRSATYLCNGAKEIHELGPMFSMHSMRMFSHRVPLTNCAARISSLHHFLRANDHAFFLIINRILPMKNKYYMDICVHQKKPVTTAGPWDALWNKFLLRDDNFRNQTLKYICNFTQAPFVVKKTVTVLGGMKRPVIMGKGYLRQDFFIGRNYIEVDVDISSSRVARTISNTVVGVAAKCLIEEAFVLEGRTAGELPERPLALQKMNHIDLHTQVCELQDDDLCDYTVNDERSISDYGSMSPVTSQPLDSFRRRPSDGGLASPRLSQKLEAFRRRPPSEGSGTMSPVTSQTINAVASANSV